jgi:hypothetical protein
MNAYEQIREVNAYLNLLRAVYIVDLVDVFLDEMEVLFPSPEYERSSRPRGARIFTVVIALLSIVIVGGTMLLNWKTLNIDDVLALIAPFVIMFFAWLFVIWMRKETGVKWIPWFPG